MFCKMADEEVVELHLIPDVVDEDGRVDGWIPGPLPMRASIYYPLNCRVGAHHENGDYYIHGEWWQTDSKTRVLRYLPLGPNHGRCHVKYGHQRYEDLFYRSHGLDPASVDWPNRTGEANIHWESTFFCEGTILEKKDGSVELWTPPDQLNLDVS